jgi:leucyl-tRNA synthetase
MDTFVNSSWYFLRYCDAKNDKEIFSKDKANYWMPIDQYIGGKEHACMHLIYFRFYTKFLRDLGLIKFDEPCINLFNQGMLHKDGVVMSKSKGNVILPEEDSVNKSVIERLVLLMSPFTPHICEEMWSKLGNKDFISLAKWPKFNESKIDEAGEAEEESISLLLADITKVMDLAKLDKLSKITVFVSESWKYDFFSKLKKKLASTRNIGEIIPACIIKGHEKDVSSLVPKLLKNESRIPKVIISQKDELKNLLDNKSKIEDQFKCSVEIISADGSSEVKAKQAMPSKPAVLVE